MFVLYFYFVFLYIFNFYKLLMFYFFFYFYMKKMTLTEWDLGNRGPDIMIFNFSNSLTSKKVGSVRAEVFFCLVEYTDVWMGG